MQSVVAPVDGALTRGRRAVAGAFLAQGFVFISLTTRLPGVQDRWDLGELALSLVLLMIVLLAGVGSVAAEVVAGRVGSDRPLRLALGAMVVCVPGLILAPSLPVMLANLAAYGVCLGVVDATANMQAVDLEHRYGRPILPSLHGCWTLGGVLAAALTLAVARLPWEVTAVVAVVPAAVAMMPFLRRELAPADPAGGREVPPVPWRPLWLVGAAMVIFYLVDTAATTWGPTYLDDVFDTPSELVALATFPYLIASGAMRLAGDALVARSGPVRVLRGGAVVAVAALAVVVFAPSWPVAVAGFTLLGAGVAVVAPLSFSAAAKIADADGAALDPAVRRARIDTVIGRFNQFNYAGALGGAVLTGLVGAGSLRAGFAVPLALVLVLWPLAKAFR